MKTPITSIEIQGFKQLNIPSDLQAHLTTHAYLYLQQHGWFNDFPEDQDGVTPWMTFPAIAFLKILFQKLQRFLSTAAGIAHYFSITKQVRRYL